MKRFRVAVVGLGVAGATVGMLLAQAGCDVTAFEQTSEPGAVGAGVLLHPSGQMVLARLGLLEKVTARAERIDRLMAATHQGRQLIDLAYSETEPGACAYGVHRGDLFMVLFEAMKGSGVSLRAGVRAARYQRRGGEVVVFSEGGEELGGFHFVVACDGAKSALRENSGISARVTAYPHGALWAMGRSDRVHGRLWQVTRGTKRLCGLLPMGGGRCSLFWSLEKRERDVFYARGFEAWRSEVAALCPEAEEVMKGLSGFEETRFTSFHHVMMPRWFDEGCVFLGDAAHAMSPHLGQGINLAMMDAVCFVYAVEQAGEFATGCALYQQMRERHLRVYAAMTYMMSPFFQSRGFVKGVLRDCFLPWMPALPWLRRQMVETMSGMRAGWLGGRVELPREDVKVVEENCGKLHA